MQRRKGGRTEGERGQHGGGPALGLRGVDVPERRGAVRVSE